MKITAKELKIILKSLEAHARNIKRLAVQSATAKYPSDDEMSKATAEWKNYLLKRNDYTETVALFEKLSNSEIDLEVEE